MKIGDIVGSQRQHVPPLVKAIRANCHVPAKSWLRTEQKNPMREIYRIEVRGHLDPKWADWFDGFDITPQDTNVTLLSGIVEVQSALHGLLAKIRDLGLSLLSVNLVETEMERSQIDNST